MSATKDLLGNLHNMLAEYFMGKLKDTEKLTVGDVQNILRFLKDNGIECSVDENSMAEQVKSQLDNTLNSLKNDEQALLDALKDMKPN